MQSPLQSPLQPVMRSPLEFRRRGGFNIASTNPSAIYDRTNLATLFQDSTGITPVTAGSQPIGLGLDQSQGLVLGPELVVNGDFDTDTNWTKDPGWSISGGVAVASAAVNGTNLRQTTTAIAGKTYEITFTIVSLSAGGVYPSVGGSVGAVCTTVGTFTQRHVAGSSAGYTGLKSAGATTGTFDNISVKLLPGNHQLQNTAGKRPIADGSPIYANFDAVDDDLVATFPASLGSGCTVCRSLPGTGASITTGVTLTATFTDNVDAHALLIYTAAQWAALDAGQIAKITTWLNAKAGL